MVNSGKLRTLSPRHHKFTLQPSSRPQHLADYRKNSSTHPHFSIDLYNQISLHKKLSPSGFILQVDRCKFFNNRMTTRNHKSTKSLAKVGEITPFHHFQREFKVTGIARQSPTLARIVYHHNCDGDKIFFLMRPDLRL